MAEKREEIGKAIAGTALSRRGFLNLGLAAGVTTLVGPRGVLAGPPGKATGQIIVGISQEPTVFNPLMPHIEVDEGVYWNLFSPLWGVDPKGNFIPQLAAEVPTVDNGGISADGLSWKIKLRSGVTWHDGAPFTAEDVKFSIELLVNPSFKSARRAGHELVKDINVVSPTEINWRMEKPYAPYPSILAWTFMVPQHILGKEKDPNTAAFNNTPVGTGPFKWGERVAGDHILLAANDKFFDKGPYVERLAFKYIPDLTVLFTQFQTGEIDYIGLQGITADHYEEAKKLKDRNVVAVPQPFIENIVCNLGLPQLKEQPVREALYCAMDKKSIIEAVYYGLPTPAESFLPTQAWAFNPDLPKHEYNPQKAKEILDAAGWKPGPDGIREKNGVRLEFINSTTAGNHVREQAQQLLQQNWKEIGVAMKIKNLPPAVMWGDYWMMSKFETAMGGTDFMVGPDPDATEYFHSKSIAAQGGAGQNATQFKNPEVDKLLEEGAATMDQQMRKAIYQRMQIITRHELAFLPIFQYSMVEGTKRGLIGFEPNVNVQSSAWNIRTWYWDA
jgi:peptide/nickel transport system substrate-binding protein